VARGRSRDRASLTGPPGKARNGLLCRTVGILLTPTRDNLRSPRVGKTTASIIICAYAEQRWAALLEAVESIEHQTHGASEVIVVIDHNPELLSRARSALPHAQVIESEGAPGLSAARNSGVSVAGGEIIAFLDDDAIAAPTWLEEIVRAFEDPEVIGVGGVADPKWSEGAAPGWLPSEFYWVIGCSYRGLPAETSPIRNPIGATMSFRSSVFDRVGGFSDGIGRVGRTPLGCEETEFSIRARKAFPEGAVLHVPAARVEHLVTPERTGWSYFRSRCWAEGLSKALVTDEAGASDALSSELTYTLKTLPTGVLHGFGDALRGDPAGLQRSLAIIAGFSITLAGYVRGRIAREAR
jgi:GT2 family glycosyltransferase